LKFRKDINGLRAIAVIAVLIFHFNASLMPGGFAGVDVFFVISGFLMTGIIFKEIEQKNFSILNFYIARANRIIPALAALCLVLLVFCWFYLPPLKSYELAKHVVSSMGFLSNVIYWKEYGYFDAVSNEKWLLHTWSLSAEWQFYIIYPLFLVAMRKFMSLKTMKAIVLMGTLLGFIFCVISTYQWPTPTYYLLPTRAWEMMIGGVAYLYPIKLLKEKKQFEWIGLALIIASFFLISKNSPWPGYLAIFPVLGTYLIIQSQCKNSLITSNIVFQKIGAWSYSIYLWHWPLVVAIYYYSLSDGFIYPGIGLSVLLGFLSYKYIEKIKFRNDFSSLKSYLKFKPLYMVLFVGFLGGSLFTYFHYQLVNIEKYKMANRNGYEYCFRPSGGESDPNCLIGNDNKIPRIIALGDSFMGQYEPFLEKVALDLDISILSLTSGACFPSFSQLEFLSDDNLLSQCLMNRAFAKKNLDNFDIVIMSTRWEESFADQLQEVYDSINLITSKGLKVIFLPLPTQFARQIGDEYLKSLAQGKDFEIENYEVNYEANQYNDKASQELKKRLLLNSQFNYIDKSIFYPKDTFIHYGKVTPFSSDGGHISVLGSKQVWKVIKKNGFYEELKVLLN
jgi:peptidoglycan/LPS O-acetylase OafA/YrhL